MTECAHLDGVQDVETEDTWLRRVPQDGRFLGPSAPLPNLRPRGLLRFIEE